MLDGQGSGPLRLGVNKYTKCNQVSWVEVFVDMGLFCICTVVAIRVDP